MTRYVFPGNMMENCTDVDLDAMYPSHISIGAGTTPVLIDWNAALGGANPYVQYSAWAGHIEIYKTGIRIYDDHGTPALNPSGGHIAAALKIQFKVTDVRGGVSTQVAQDILYLQGIVPGSDPVAPTVIDLLPAVGAVSVPVDNLITLTWSKALLVGAGSIQIRNVTTNTLIQTLNLPADLTNVFPPAPGKIYLSDSQTVIRPSSDLPNNSVISVRPGADFVRNLSGTANIAITNDALSFTTISSGTSLWGYTPNVDYGTVGDMFVDVVNGNDGNNGLTVGAAKKTLTAAFNAWTNNVGGKIKVRGGVYNEMPTVKSGAGVGNELIVEPYGNETPIISGAEPMTTGWVACTIADQALVGANYAAMLKKTGVPINTFPRSDPMNANLFAGSTRLNIARKYKYGQNVATWVRSLDLLTADSVTLSGTTIVAYQHAALLAAFTPFQLEKAIMIAQASPNLVTSRRVTISGADIVPSSPVNRDTNTGVNWHNNFGMFNLIAAMEQGGWAYDWDGVSATCDLYVWLPAGKTVADINYSARMNAVMVGRNHIKLKGLIAERYAGSCDRLDFPTGSPVFADAGCGFSASATGSTRTNITIENCVVRRGWNQTIKPNHHLGGISITGVNGLIVRKCTIEDLQASEGVTPTIASNVLVEWNKFDNIYKEDLWPRDSQKVVFAHNLHVGSRLGHTHNNGVAFYVVNEGLEWGNIWINADFYGTWQDANNIQFCFNFFEWVGSYNAIKDQSGSVNGFASTIGGMILNNTIAYSAFRIFPVTQSIACTEGVNHPFSVKNNIYYGATWSATTTGNGSNINTRTSADLPAATGNQREGLDVVFRDRATRDFSIGPSSVIRSVNGTSIATEISALQSTYPMHTDWTDPFGQTINFAAPKIGAMSNLDTNPVLAS